MLETIKKSISEAEELSLDFSDFYIKYLMRVQDMDIENEILPYVKDKTTSYLKKIRKLERSRTKRSESFNIL